MLSPIAAGVDAQPPGRRTGRRVDALARPDERAGGRELVEGARLRGAGRAEGRLPADPERGAGRAEDPRGGAGRVDGLPRLGVARGAERLVLGAARAEGRLPPQIRLPADGRLPPDGRLVAGALPVLGRPVDGLLPVAGLPIRGRLDPEPTEAEPRLLAGTRADGRSPLLLGDGAASVPPRAPGLPLDRVPAVTRAVPAPGLIVSEGLRARWAPSRRGGATMGVLPPADGRLAGWAVRPGAAPPAELAAEVVPGRRLAVLVVEPRGSSL